MKKIRIGKDISVRWPILTNGEAQSLDGRDLKLFMKSQYNVAKEIKFSTEDNIVLFTYPGTEQQMLGIYKLTLWENYGKRGQTAVDCCEAFQLVSCTCKEEPDCGGFTPEEVALEPSTIEVGIGSTGSSLPAGGTAGQVLTKTADGAAWQDAPGSGAALPFKVVTLDFNGKPSITISQEAIIEYQNADIVVVQNVYQIGKTYMAVGAGVGSGNFYVGISPQNYLYVQRSGLEITCLKRSYSTTLSGEVAVEESDTASSDLATIGDPGTIAEE